MEPRTFTSSKLSMLMACASPGSALAFHLGLASNGARLLRRTSSGEPQAARSAAGPVASAAVPFRAVSAFLSGLAARVHRWSDSRLQAERERYLAQVQNVSDLEARMRDLHSGRYWLP